MNRAVGAIAFAHQPANGCLVPYSAAGELDELDTPRLRNKPPRDRHAAVRAGDIEHQIVTMAARADHVARDAFIEADQIEVAAGLDDLVMAVAETVHIDVVTHAAAQLVVAAKAHKQFFGGGTFQHILMLRTE